MNETFSVTVNQIFEGYTVPPDDYSIAHTRFKEERPYVCGLAFDFGKEGLIYEENKGLFDVLYCSTAAVFAVVVSLVGDVLWRRFGASVERLPRYLQELYQQAYNSARIAYEESNGKLNAGVQFQSSTLQEMLALPEGDEDAFIEAQVAAGKPVENLSKREVEAAVKKWKSDKKKKSSPPFEEINLFPEEEESGAVIQSVDKPKIDGDGEYEPNPDFDSSDSELNSKPTEESDEIVDDTADEKNSDDELNMMRTETQKMLVEISE